MINNPKILPDVKLKVEIRGVNKYTGKSELIYSSQSLMQRFHDEELDLNLQEIRDEIATNLAREVCMIPSYTSNKIVIIMRDNYSHLSVDVFQAAD